MTRAVRAGLRVLLRAFFRRVEVVGRERVPAAGPLVLVANHPSGLVDPMLILAHAPRLPAFLAKEPLFRMPVLGAALRALGAIPVHRRQDGADPRLNRPAFRRAHALLADGGVLAIFPEGTSHDDPRMKRLRSGAARIALGARPPPGAGPVRIVPVGLFFTDKGTFRSEALVSFGAPIAVAPAAAQGDATEPAPVDVRALTARIEAALAEVVVQADAAEALALASGAERLFTAGAPVPLAERVALQRRLLEGRRRLAALDPRALGRLERRVRIHLATAELAAAPAKEAIARDLARAAGAALLAPCALAGVAVHAPAWLGVDRIARRAAGDDRSLAATVKLLAGAVLYPLTWGAIGAVAGAAWGAPAGAIAALAAVGSGVAAVAAAEAAEPAARLARRLALRLARGPALGRLAREQESLRAALRAAAERVEAGPQPAAR